MAYSAAANQSSLNLGNLLKILSEGAVYNQLSTSSEIWQHILKRKAAEDQGRQKRYEIMTQYGPAAVQATGFSSTAAFPAGQRSTLAEGIAQYKDIDLTVEYDLTLESRTGSDLMQYARPLAHEMDAKGIVASRILSHMCMGDGSGAIGRISAIDATATSNQITITLNATTANAGRSHVGWFELGDIIKCAAEDSTARTLVDAGGTATTAQVVDIDYDNNTITIAKDPSNASELTQDGAWAAGDYIYRKGTTPQDLSAISTNDYNTLSEYFPGLEALTEDNGILVNNITMSGAAGGSRYGNSGATLSKEAFQKLLSKVKRRVGAGRYKYTKALMAHDTYDAMVAIADADKTFFNVVDFQSGAKKVGYTHGRDSLEFIPDEFVPKQRIYVLPDEKGVLEFHGRDFKRVKLGGQGEFLKTNGSGQYLKQSQAFMSAGGVLIAKHPAALGVLEDFATS